MFKLGGLFIPDTPTPKDGLHEDKNNLSSLALHLRLDYQLLFWKRPQAPSPESEECRSDSDRALEIKPNYISYMIIISKIIRFISSCLQSPAS